jgi:hydrogenase-4 component F
VFEVESLALASIVVPIVAAIVVCVVPRRLIVPSALLFGLVTGGVTFAVAARGILDVGHPTVGDWIVLDAAGALLVAVIGAVGLISVLLSPGYLAGLAPAATRGPRRYFAVLFAFWAALVAVPLAGNLGAAWLLIEATTAASALLVGFSGKPRALEAGWKYLVLTSLGLGVALLGIALIAAGVPNGGLGALSWQALAGYSAGSQAGLVAYLLVMAGLAAKIGWAPVHNWLPDAHSEAPAPVSAMLSAALLPAVLLIAWRCQQGMATALGDATSRAVFLAFGLGSVAVAVPFLGKALPWKRLLAYSSLEHMGIIAIGIGFASPLALAGVAVHVAGHAIAKSLGFFAVTPLLAHDPTAARSAVTGVGRSQPALAASMGLSLTSLAGLPPSPLFVSELLIVAGGFQAGYPWLASLAALLIALAFLGLLKATLETTTGDSVPAGRPGRLAGLRPVLTLAVVSAVLLLALTGVGVLLPDSAFVPALLKGIQ